MSQPPKAPSDVKILLMLLLFVGGFFGALAAIGVGLYTLWDETTEVSLDTDRAVAEVARAVDAPSAPEPEPPREPEPPPDVTELLRERLTKVQEREDITPELAESMRRLQERLRPAAAPPSMVRFTEHSVRTSSNGALWIYGLIQNASDVDVSRIRVTARLLDPDGNVVHEKTVPSTTLSHLGAGNRAPMQILVTKPPPYAEITYTAEAVTGGYVSPKVEGLKVIPGQKPKKRFNAYTAKGVVENDGTQPARFVKVQIVGYDKHDKVVGIGQTYAVGAEGRLEPGGRAPFKTSSLRFARPPVRFAYSVNGSPLEE